MSWSEAYLEEVHEASAAPAPSTSTSRRPSWAPGAVLWAERSGKKWIPCRRTGCSARILFVESPNGKATPIECVGTYPDGTRIFEMHADNCVDAGNTGGYEPRISHRTRPTMSRGRPLPRGQQSMF